MRRLLFVLPLAALIIAACGDDDDGGASSTPAANGAERATEDRPDEVTGPQVHLMYVLPSDGTDRRLDTDGTIARSFLSAQQWLAGQTDGAAFRLDTFEGAPDVTFFTLSRTDREMEATDAFVRDEIEGEMRRAGFDARDKLYAVYYGGSSNYACGGGAYPPALEGTVAALYLHGEPEGTTIRCGDNEFAPDVDSPVFWEFVVIHELLHTLGFVAECAPNETFSGHITGPANDLMYEGEEDTDVPRALDPGHDDYYGHDDADCLDLEDSRYLSR